MDELPYWRDGSLEKYTPSGDYVVVKFARWAFEKFRNVQDKLGTQMRAVGEVMSIGKNYKEAFQKAIRSLERGCAGLGFYKDFNSLSLEEILEKLKEPSSQRQFLLYEAIRKGASLEQLEKMTAIKHYFMVQMKELVEEEEEILKYRDRQLPAELLIQAKKDGFSDKYLAQLLKTPEEIIRNQRLALGMAEAWEAVPVSGVQDACYWFSSYNLPQDTSTASGNAKKVMVLGGGPIRIGQGIEFDYSSVHCVWTLREMGYDVVIFQIISM